MQSTRYLNAAEISTNRLHISRTETGNNVAGLFARWQQADCDCMVNGVVGRLAYADRNCMSTGG